MSNTKLVKRFLSNLLTWPVYLLSCVVPRSKKIWVFGSYPGTFLDNSKYLFLKFYQRDSPYGDIKAIWITKSKALAREMRANGYRCYLKFSIKGIYYCL